MSDTRDFDPRFDAAFQRGYVEGGPRAPRQEQSRPAIIEPPSQWASVPQVMDARDRPDAPAHAIAAPPQPAVSLAGNPWVRALWVIAPVFIVVGVVGQGWAQSKLMGSFSSTSPDAFSAYIIPSVAQSLCPWMVLTGLAALVGVVLLNAVRWRGHE